MNQPFHADSPEALAQARRYHAQSLEDLEEAGAERMRWTMNKNSSLRLDKYVQGRLKGTSRSQVQKLIELGAVTVNGNEAKPSQKLRGDDVVEVVVPPKPADDLIAEDIPLDILYEDDGFIAINKQAGFIVHPARSHLTGTMLNALAWHFQHHPGNSVELKTNDNQTQAIPEHIEGTNRPPSKPKSKKKTKPALSSVGQDKARPGVIHRLDMNTTGVILFGKQDESHWLLAKQFEDRTNTKAYLAVVHGNPQPSAGTIEEPLGKHPTIREGQAVRQDSTGKHALTLYRVREHYDGYALVEVQIKTGRTHQIRVHMQYLGFPIVGDLLYGGELVGPREIENPPHPAGARPHLNYARPKDEGKKLEARAIDRLEQGDAHPDGAILMPTPALHAGYLQVRHPIHRHDMTFTAPLHEPMLTLVKALRKRPHPDGLKGVTQGALIDMELTVPAS
ncbi:RluA family pseudouridine synthase [Phycisphaeraceae bacterium D3-23]